MTPRISRRALFATLAALCGLVVAQPSSAAPSLGGVRVPESGLIVPQDPKLTPAQVNWLLDDYPKVSEEFPPVCRWENRDGQKRRILYVKIEDQRTPADQLKVTILLFNTASGDQTRPVIFRPGVGDFMIDITDSDPSIDPRGEIARMGALDGEGWYSGMSVSGNCDIGVEPVNQYFPS